MLSQAKKQGFDSELLFNFCFLIFILGIVGSRLLYILQNINYYLKAPKEIFMLPHGGLSWFGGLITGIIFGLVYLKRKKLSYLKVFDLIAPFLSLAQAIGRVGCLLNGCCFGKVSRFGLYFKVHQAVLIPTQLYSSLALLFIFIILRRLQERPHKEGEIFFFYLLLYSTKRFLIEFWRADTEKIILGLSLFQIMSMIIFLFSLIKILKIKLKV